MMFCASFRGCFGSLVTTRVQYRCALSPSATALCPTLCIDLALLCTGMFSAANLQALFACIADLPSSSESEARLNNATRAEVFAGVLRAYRLHALRSNTLSSAEPSGASL
jgi:hypothetical protein